MSTETTHPIISVEKPQSVELTPDDDYLTRYLAAKLCMANFNFFQYFKVCTWSTIDFLLNKKKSRKRVCWPLIVYVGAAISMEQTILS